MRVEEHNGKGGDSDNTNMEYKLICDLTCIGYW
jgi:hypothetical protein